MRGLLSPIILVIAISSSCIFSVVVGEQYPCRTISIFGFDMSSDIGNVHDQSLFHKQTDLVTQAYHRWNLGFNDVRIGIPTPNGALNGGNFELMQDIPTINDVLSSIKDNDDTAFVQSSLQLQLENIANQFLYATTPEENIDYNIVLFTGSQDSTEISKAIEQRKNLIDNPKFRTRVIVVSLFPNQPIELQYLQNGGLINIDDPNFYFTLTNDICNGDITGDPDDVPTAAPVAAFPGNIDLFIQFSATGCPAPSNLNTQISFIKDLVKNYTFEETGVRAAIPVPIGMISFGNSVLIQNKETILQTIQTMDSLSKNPSFCSQGQTITNALKSIEQHLRIKENSSAAMILFSDSTDSTDISLAATWRIKNLDSRNFLLVPVQLEGSASLSVLATNKNQTFSITDYNLQTEITEALISAQPFINTTRFV